MIQNINKEEEKNNQFSSDTNLGFGYLQCQDDEPFRNFLKKIEVDESTKKLTLSFSKFADQPIVIDFDTHKMKLPSNKEKEFKKFTSVTFEYALDKKAILIKTFRFLKGKLEMGVKEIKIEDKQMIKLTNVCELQENNYSKTAQKIIEKDNKYVIPVPDFYKKCFAS